MYAYSAYALFIQSINAYLWSLLFLWFLIYKCLVYVFLVYIFLVYILYLIPYILHLYIIKSNLYIPSPTLSLSSFRCCATRWIM